jgi:hypothetical protein
MDLHGTARRWSGAHRDRGAVEEDCNIEEGGGRPYMLCACLARVRWRSSRPPHHRSRREVELSRVGVCERVQGGIPEYLLL